MRYLKRVVAGVLCASMLLNMNGIVSYAATNNVVSEDTSEENSDFGLDTSETESLEEASTEAVLESTETENTTSYEATQEAEVTLPRETSEDVQEKAPLVNWLVVAEDYITSSMEQNVLVDIGDENSNITDATLTYVHKESGQTYEQSMTGKDDTLLTFRLAKDTISKSGEYVIQKLTVVSDETSYDIDLTAIGIEAKFGVEVSVDTDADVYLMDQDSTEPMDGVVVTDAEGNQISGSDIGEAISDVGGKARSKRTADGDIVVVLDPGHGGSDGGAGANGVVEKVVNLKIAQYCMEQLKQYGGVEVYMTRYSDVYVGLEDRVNYAASVGADLFVSLHNNSSSSGANGTEVYYPNANYNPNAHVTGAAVSQAILNALTALGLANRGTHVRYYSPSNGASTTDYYPDGSVSDYYSVIRNSKLRGFPGIIVEHAFVSSAYDAANFLTSESSLRALGEADADAIASYFGLSSANGTVFRGVDYSAVFDFDYYVNKYEDIKENYGNNRYGALKHFVLYGMKEKRQGCADFNVKYYMNRYVDLRNKYGDDYGKYYLHYINSGKEEGRDGKTYSARKGTVTVYHDVDYSAVYDFDYYQNQYQWVKKQFGEDDIATIKHFVYRGMKEARQAKDEFNVTYYKNRYVDLRNKYGEDLVQYYLHYIKYGKKGRRDGKTYSDVVGAVTIYNGVDYSAVYNFSFYQKKYNYIKRTYGTDDIATLKHFINKGMKEGRQAISTFDVNAYACRYSDLRKQFKNNLKQYYLHYMNKGKAEKRKATGTKIMQGGVRKYQGKDYSAVYQLGYYANKYPYLFKTYGYDDAAYIKHFVTKGMKEGRQAKAEFNVTNYKNRYVDLRNKFGNDLTKYYLHYISSGKREGRDGKTYSARKGYVTMYNGVNYRNVYNYYYYQKKYNYIKRTYGEDDIKTLEHFVNKGIKEGRQACATFDVTSYRYANPDLRKVYRNNIYQYVLHYIKTGKNEHRKATGVTKLQKPWTVYNGKDYSGVYNFWQFRKDYPELASDFGMDDYGLLEYYVTVFSTLTPVSGKATTTVNEMTRYFKSRASYPAFYAGSDAPTIEAFCQIVYEESVAEGIDPAVTFCQAMKETGFLRFGGDVSITQYNFAGLGATGGGVPGQSFSNVRHGIRSQVQHLKAYANRAPLRNACVDSRFSYVTRGSAPYVEWLGIHENPYGRGWAAARNYGYSLKRDYMLELYRY